MPRKVSRLKSSRRPPRRGQDSTSQCSHAHTLRSTSATPTYNSRNSGSRVLVRCCGRVVLIASVAAECGDRGDQHHTAAVLGFLVIQSCWNFTDGPGGHGTTFPQR